MDCKSKNKNCIMFVYLKKSNTFARVFLTEQKTIVK